MNCKFCNAELEEGVTLCPECGRENLEEVVEQTPMETAEEAPEAYAEAPEETDEQSAVEEPTVPEAAPRQKPKPWLVVLAVIGALAIAAVLGIAVYFGISASKAPKSYTVSDAKAASARNTVVATVGDLELTNSQLQVCYQMVCNDFRNYYGSYLDASILDFSKPLDTQFYDEEEGITWQQHFLDNALTSWSRYAALYMQAKEDGFTLDAESQAYLEGFPEQLKEMASTYGFESAEEGADQHGERHGRGCGVLPVPDQPCAPHGAFTPNRGERGAADALAPARRGPGQAVRHPAGVGRAPLLGV